MMEGDFQQLVHLFRGHAPAFLDLLGLVVVDHAEGGWCGGDGEVPGPHRRRESSGCLVDHPHQYLLANMSQQVDQFVHGKQPDLPLTDLW